MEWFRSQHISPTVTRIAGVSGELMYLVEGSEWALLIDSGVGVGDIARYLLGLTALPVTLVMTHGHLDHAAGVPLFEEAWLHPADWALAREHSRLEIRKEYVGMMPGGSDVPEDAYVPPYNGDFRTLEDGMVFELGGGAAVQMLQLPGHTRGSMVAWIRHERSVLLGDACNPFTFLFDENTLPVAAYREQLVAFLARHRDKYDRVYLSHGPGDGDVGMVEGVLAVCDDILVGRVDNVPFTFMGGTYAIAKAMDPAAGTRVDGGVGNVVYNPARV